MATRGKAPKMMAAPKTWTDREVLDLVRAALAVRDAGLMRRMQAVWSGSESAPLSPLSEFFRDQQQRYDLFGFGHEAGAEFWNRISAALEGHEYERATEKIALQRHVREILRMATSHHAAARGVAWDEKKVAGLWRQLEGRDGETPPRGGVSGKPLISQANGGGR